MASEAFHNGDVHTRSIENDFEFDDLAPETAPALPGEEELEERNLTVEVGGRRFEVRFWAPVLMSPSGGQRAAPRRRAPKLSRETGDTGGEGTVVAPMQGGLIF